MIKHIFKIIWADRRINAWILIELILVFCILWFCTDYLYFIGKRYFEPKGFDIEHTYRIGVAVKTETLTPEIEETMEDDFWAIYERIKQHPAVEFASVSLDALPYSPNYSGGEYTVDSVVGQVQEKMVLPDFFNVFKIKTIKGKIFDQNDIVLNNASVISSDRDGLFIQKPVEQVDYINAGRPSEIKVTGVVTKTKDSEYDDYTSILYRPLQRDDIELLSEYSEICVRVRPEADKNFAEQFMQDMESQLEIGVYYLAVVSSFQKYRHEYLVYEDYDNNFKSIYSISAFLIINIFLGVIGTFWFRIQSRRSEIGLRAALGASKGKIKKLFVGETILLLFIASLVAAIICVNIAIVDVLKDIDVLPVPAREDVPVGVAQHFINYGITFIFLALIAIVAVWYPAKKASDIQPTEALRNE